jgi:hypothetical protein
MIACQAFQANGKAHVGHTDHILNLEICKTRFEPNLLYDFSVFTRRRFEIRSAMANGAKEFC